MELKEMEIVGLNDMTSAEREDYMDFLCAKAATLGAELDRLEAEDIRSNNYYKTLSQWHLVNAQIIILEDR